MSFRIKIVQNLIGINENLVFYPKLKKYYSNKLKKTEPVILDVGSNKGQSIRFFLSLNNSAIIHCFEPNKKLYKSLFKKNKSNKNITINNHGISDKSGSLIFYENVMNETSSFESLNYDSIYLKKKASVLGVKVNEIIKAEYEVTVSTLKKYIQTKMLKNIDVIKIDVEGHELNCLQGLFTNDPQDCFIKYIQLEQHNDDMYKNNSNWESILEILNKNGFYEDAKIKHGFGDFYEVIYKNSKLK